MCEGQINVNVISQRFTYICTNLAIFYINLENCNCGNENVLSSFKTKHINSFTIKLRVIYESMHLFLLHNIQQRMLKKHLMKECQ